jgi:hypothetical protein
MDTCFDGFFRMVGWAGSDFRISAIHFPPLTSPPLIFSERPVAGEFRCHPPPPRASNMPAPRFPIYLSAEPGDAGWGVWWTTKANAPNVPSIGNVGTFGMLQSIARTFWVHVPGHVPCFPVRGTAAGTEAERDPTEVRVPEGDVELYHPAPPPTISVLPELVAGARCCGCQRGLPTQPITCDCLVNPP